MAAKTPKLEYVRFTRAKGKLYAYFDTGARKANGRPVYVPMPPFGSVGFYDSYASFQAARARREKPQYTVADLARDYEASKEFAELKPNSRKVYRSSLKKIVEFLGKGPVSDLTSEDVQFILDNQFDGAGSHNNFLAVVGTMYTWARGPRGGRKTTARPTEGIAKRKTGEHAPWAEDVLEAGIQAEDDQIRLAVRLLYFTGQRIGDVLKMRWSDVKDGRVSIVQEKTGKRVWVKQLAELREELDRTPRRGLTILTDKDGKRRKYDHVLAELTAFTEAQGRRAVPHGLRKNAVNSLLLAGCSIAEVASITGQTFAIVEHYARQIDQTAMGDAAILKFENKRGQRKPDRKLA